MEMRNEEDNILERECIAKSALTDSNQKSTFRHCPQQLLRVSEKTFRNNPNNSERKATVKCTEIHLSSLKQKT